MTIQMSLSAIITLMSILACSARAHPTIFTNNEVPFPFIDRAAWGAKPPTKVRPLSTPVPYVVIHHTYIPGACNTTEQCSKDMRSMQRYHQDDLHWDDIGYNFCVGGDGAAYEGRGWRVVGVHARDANTVSVGICLIGDWRYELPPQRQLQTTKALIAQGVDLGILSPDYKLVGANQATLTKSPGAALIAEISTWEHYSSIDWKMLTKY